ncbi:MAG TPA: DUF5701 family protein [Herpetosiphonaceae bacterium]
MSRMQFQQQVERLVSLGYPGLLGVTSEEFEHVLRPLEEYVPSSAHTAGRAPTGTVDFVVVINARRVPVEAMLPLITRDGRQAVEHLYPKRPEEFVPIESLDLPDGEAYLLVGVDRGADTLNVTPDRAYQSIAARGRSPLTIAEGIALLTHVPELLQPNNCFSLLASRCGDRRVPALWLSAGRPKLGWCWAGNPHTWLGSASCARRVGSVWFPSPVSAT